VYVHSELTQAAVVPANAGQSAAVEQATPLLQEPQAWLQAVAARPVIEPVASALLETGTTSGSPVRVTGVPPETGHAGAVPQAPVTYWSVIWQLSGLTVSRLVTFTSAVKDPATPATGVQVFVTVKLGGVLLHWIWAMSKAEAETLLLKVPLAWHSQLAVSLSPSDSFVFRVELH
jgi:hypothetical protein